MRRALAVVLVLIPALAFAGKPITFSADRMSGTAGKKGEKTVLSGNAKVQVGSLEITGERIELSGKDFRIVEATGKVGGVDSEKGYTFSADSLRYDRQLEVAVFLGNVKLQDTQNEVEASAGIIQYSQKTEIALLQLDVKLTRRDISCTSAFAVYRRALSLLDLSGTPQVLRGPDEFRAERISVNLDTEHITLEGTVSGNLKDTKEESAAPAATPEQPGVAAPETPASAPQPAQKPEGQGGRP